MANTTIKTCKLKWCGSDNTKKAGLGYCAKHYKQHKKHGRVFLRSFRDQSPVIISKGTAKMPIYHGYHATENYKGTAIFDEDMADDVLKRKWQITGEGYVATSDHKGYLTLHGLVMDGKMIDHINGNKLDNRRSNLRFATIAQNALNRKTYINSTTGYKGVVYDRIKHLYRARISVDNRRIHIGRYETPEEAAWMYDQYALQLHGEFSRTNFNYEDQDATNF